jgi:hypothetical protein
MMAIYVLDKLGAVEAALVGMIRVRNYLALKIWMLGALWCAYWFLPIVAQRTLFPATLLFYFIFPLVVLDSIVIYWNNRRLLRTAAAFEALCLGMPVDGSIPEGAVEFVWPDVPGDPWLAVKTTLLTAPGLVVLFAPNPRRGGSSRNGQTRVNNKDGTFTVHVQGRTFNCVHIIGGRFIHVTGDGWGQPVGFFHHHVAPVDDGWDMHVFQHAFSSGRMSIGRVHELSVPLGVFRVTVDGEYAIHYEPTGNQLVRISPIGVPHTVSVPIVMWLALKEKKKISVYETQTILSSERWKELGLRPIEKDDAQLVVSASGVVVADPSVLRYTMSDYSLGQDELGREAGHVISGHAVDANGLFPRMGLPNEITSAQTRLLCFQTAEVLMKEVDVEMTVEMFDIISEFVTILPHGLVVQGVEEVELRQTRPGQRRQIADTLARGFDPKSKAQMTKAMLKLESYAEIKEPRTVLNDDGPHKLPYSQVCGAIAAALKEYPWYGFGHTPRATAERVARILSRGDFAVETDYSRYDGRILKLSRVACAMALERMFGGTGWLKWVMTLYENSVACNAVSTNGFRYYTGYSRLTGSPETSVMNTLFNAIAVYYALRRCGMETIDTLAYFDNCVVVAGDDGLMSFPGQPDLARYEAALVEWGLKVKANLRRRQNGDRCSFLARWYSPVWGDPNSCCDSRRQLPRLHLSASAALNQISPEEECFAKALAILTSDAETPVIGHWARTVVRLYGQDPNRFLPYSDDLYHAVDAMVKREETRKLMPWQMDVLGMTRGEDWYPNTYEVWMEDLLCVSYDGRVSTESLHEYMSALNSCATFKDLDLVPSLVPFSMSLELPRGAVVTVDGVYGPIPDVPLAAAPTQVKSPVPQHKLRRSIADGRGRPKGRRARAREAGERRASQSSAPTSESQ